MLDYFKKIKRRKDSEEKAEIKPKKDKVFITILAAFAVISIVGVIWGVSGSGVEKTVGNIDFKFRFSIVDGVILGGAVLSYIICKIQKRGKK